MMDLEVRDAARPPAIPNWERWVLRTPLRTSGFSALAYVVLQPAMVWLTSTVFREAIPFSTLSAWNRFELTELALGSFVGWAFFYTRRWGRRSWRRNWAEWGIPTVALSATMSAHRLSTMSALGWISLALLTGAGSGALLATAASCVYRLAGSPAAVAHDPEADAVFD
jgi:hypothetical protein